MGRENEFFISPGNKYPRQAIPTNCYLSPGAGPIHNLGSRDVTIIPSGEARLIKKSNLFRLLSTIPVQKNFVIQNC